MSGMNHERRNRQDGERQIARDLAYADGMEHGRRIDTSRSALVARRGKVIRLKYPSACATCNEMIATNAQAVWHPKTPTRAKAFMKHVAGECGAAQSR